ncbi:MAG: metallopeptidase family protein [Rhodothalassiaceae bacterium]
MSDPVTRWSETSAPSPDDLAALAEAAFARLPETFRQHLGAIIFEIRDFPDEALCRDMGLDSPFDLLGLYHGVSLDQKSVWDSGALPDRIFLYRRPILDYWCAGEDELGAILTHVLVHEIGHHFGLSDADMDAIEAAAGEA